MCFLDIVEIRASRYVLLVLTHVSDIQLQWTFQWIDLQKHVLFIKCGIHIDKCVRGCYFLALMYVSDAQISACYRNVFCMKYIFLQIIFVSGLLS